MSSFTFMVILPLTCCLISQDTGWQAVQGLYALASGGWWGVGLDPMLAFLAPNDQPDLGRGSIAERHRRTQHLGKALQHRLYGLGVIPKVPQIERQSMTVELRTTG